MPSGSRGESSPLPVHRWGNGRRSPSTPRGSRPSCRATASRSAGSTTRGTGRAPAAVAAEGSATSLGWSAAAVDRGAHRRWCATARCTRGRCCAPPPTSHRHRSPRRRPAAAEPGRECRRASRTRAARGPARRCTPDRPAWLLRLGSAIWACSAASLAAKLLHLGALSEIRAHRPGDGQRQHAHHRRQDRRAPCGESQPLFTLLLRPPRATARRMGSTMLFAADSTAVRLGGPASRLAAGEVRDRFRPSTARPGGRCRRFDSGRLPSATAFSLPTRVRRTGKAKSPA